jgi:hypothetical protein
VGKAGGGKASVVVRDVKHTSEEICRQNPLDSRAAIITLEIKYEEDEWAGDLCDEEDQGAAERASKIESEATSAGEVLSQYLEDKALELIRTWIPAGRILQHQSSYDDNGVLNISLDVRSIEEVAELSKHFQQEGFNYEVPYITITGMMLFPGGVNKPRFGLESSNAEYSLEEWLEVWK